MNLVSRVSAAAAIDVRSLFYSSKLVLEPVVFVPVFAFNLLLGFYVAGYCTREGKSYPPACHPTP